MTHRSKASFKSAFLLSSLASSWALVCPESALAQTVTGEVSMQRFDPAPGTGNFLSTRGANMDGKMQFSGGLMVNYGYKPFVADNCVVEPCDDPNNIRSVAVVENVVTADLLAALTIIPQLQIGLKVPVTWLNGQGTPGAGNQLTGLEGIGLGDIQLEAKGRFYGKPGDAIVLGAFAYGGFPIGNLMDEGKFLSNASMSLGVGAIAGGEIADFSWSANLGALVREAAEVGDPADGGAKLGTEGRFGVGAGYQIGPMLKIVADVFGGSSFGGPGTTNIEGLLGAQLRPMTFPITFTVGGGAGLYKGIGAAKARVLVGALYNYESRDRDGDGFLDDADSCPTDPEDRDGFEDGDGCPELDNDADMLPDDVDKCPDKPEDFDGFEDKDGCPELDNDGDGLNDVSDQCPLEPETKNDFLDDDGCPDEKDSDGDGIVDTNDKCVDELEDTDGFEDTDGCPDPDNDGDGFPDTEDECIDLPEDGEGKGRLAEDGCPRDTDQDGVPDMNDKCPKAIEDMQGEGDQIKDGCPIDQTPASSGAAPAPKSKPAAAKKPAPPPPSSDDDLIELD